MKLLIKNAASSLLFLLLASGCGRHDSSTHHAILDVIDVETAKVEYRPHIRSQWLPGTVYPSDQATIASRMMATVDQAELTIGQEVQKDEVLVILRADEVDARVDQARASLSQLERNYERERALLSQSATTAETVRTLEDQIRLARARLEEAMTMEGYKYIRAPFDGFITSKNVRRGDLATPGMPVLTMEGTGSYKVHVQVPDSLSSLDNESVIQIEADGKAMTARLAEWSPAADPASRSRLAKLSLPMATSLRSGQYVRVNWPAGETNSLWIPKEAVSPLGQMQRAYVVNNQHAELRLVRTGAGSAGFIQILSGLSVGETVILNPPATIRDLQPINIIQ